MSGLRGASEFQRMGVETHALPSGVGVETHPRSRALPNFGYTEFIGETIGRGCGEPITPALSV